MLPLVEVEPISAVVRIWDNQSGYGAPYDWVATLRWVDKDTVEVIGTTTAPTRTQWKALVIKAKEIGVKRVLVTRCKHGILIKHYIEVL